MFLAPETPAFQARKRRGLLLTQTENIFGFDHACVRDIDHPTLIEITGVLGVDLAIVRFATNSDGKARTNEAIEKAQLAGMPVLYVDSRHTSCSCRGCIDDRNRPNQATLSSFSACRRQPSPQQPRGRTAGRDCQADRR
jgi:hypothetical protein